MHSGWIQAIGLSVRQNKEKAGFDLGTFGLWSQNTTFRPTGQALLELKLGMKCSLSCNMSFYWKNFHGITFCKSSEIFNSKLFKISQSPVRFDFFPTKYRLMPSYVLNPKMVPLGAPCKTIALKTAFYIGNLTNLWKSVLNLCAKLVFSLCLIAQKCIL